MWLMGFDVYSTTLRCGEEEIKMKEISGGK